MKRTLEHTSKKVARIKRGKGAKKLGKWIPRKIELRKAAAKRRVKG